ncbi:MAG: chromosome segregation protein SMC, partial [Lachnospiraceae bacterium]|nr:chromosome segregation protein SMC [Candidatus Equihabitans merdae]
SLRYKEEETEARQVMEEGSVKKANAKAEIEEMEKQASEYENAIRASQAFLNEHNQKLDQLQTTYHRDASRMESLKNLEEQYDGYGNGIRRVMDEKPNQPGIVGVVAELLHVDKAYELAIETALGSKTRNIVTEEEQTAKRMIEFLKKNRLGRATFLPMTHINRVRKFDRDDVLAEPGVVGLGSSLVTTEKGYEILADYLLGRTLVIDNIDHALKIGAKYHHSLNMVTLQGELFTPGGAITGGAFKNNTQLLGRKREIEELETKTVKTKEELTALQKALEDKRQIRNKARQDLEELHNRLQDARIRLNTTELELRQAEEVLTDNRLSSQGLKLESSEISGQIDEIKASKQTMEDEMAQSEEAEAKLNEEGSKLTQQEDILNAKKALQTEKLESVHVKVAALREQLSYIHANKERLLDEIQTLKDEDESLIESREMSGSEIEDRQQAIADAEQEMLEIQETIEKAGDKERELVDQKSQQAITHKSFFDKREALSETINRLDKEQYRLTSQQERLVEESDKQTAYLWEEYEITPSEARAMRKEEYTDRVALKKEAAKIKEEIKALGHVNVTAIEEYKQVSERHT